MMVKVNGSFCLRRNKQPASRRRRPKQAAHLLFSPKHPMEALLSALVRACERAFTEADFWWELMVPTVKAFQHRVSTVFRIYVSLHGALLRFRRFNQIKNVLKQHNFSSHKTTFIYSFFMFTGLDSGPLVAAWPRLPPRGMGVAEVSREALILSQGAGFHLLSTLIKDSVNNVAGSRGGDRWRKREMTRTSFLRFKADVKVKNVDCEKHAGL